MAEKAVQPPPKQRRQRRTNRQWHVTGVGVIGERQAGDDVDRPSVKTVVQKGVPVGRLQSIFRIRRDGARQHHRIRTPKPERLSGGKHHQADTEARPEHHGKPGEVRELGFFPGGSELPLAGLRQHRQHHQKENEAADNDDVKGVEAFQQGPVQTAQHAVRIGGPDQRPEYKTDHDRFTEQCNLKRVALIEARRGSRDRQIREWGFDCHAAVLPFCRPNRLLRGAIIVKYGRFGRRDWCLGGSPHDKSRLNRLQGKPPLVRYVCACIVCFD